MLGKGNSDPERCTANLMKIARGEVPMDRIRGLNANLTGNPCAEAEEELVSDAEWVIETWEPRAQINQITVSQDKEGGSLTVDADISVAVEEQEEPDE